MQAMRLMTVSAAVATATAVMLASLTTCSHAQVVPCDSPVQWEAGYAMFNPREGHEFTVHGRYSYDKLNLRKRRYEEVDDIMHPDYQFLEVIELFKDEKRYVIDMRTRLCHEEPLYHPDEKNNGFHDHDVPSGARLDGVRVLGCKDVEEGYLNISQWSYRYVDRQYNWAGSFTFDKCIPTRSDAFNSTTFGLIFEEFYDVVPGISDPNVFIPPAQCIGQTNKIYRHGRTLR
eukprot:scpid86964/ scgid9014/ Mammalian ependymin-related protein 1